MSSKNCARETWSRTMPSYLVTSNARKLGIFPNLAASLVQLRPRELRGEEAEKLVALVADGVGRQGCDLVDGGLHGGLALAQVGLALRRRLEPKPLAAGLEEVWYLALAARKVNEGAHREAGDVAAALLGLARAEVVELAALQCRAQRTTHAEA